MPNVDIKKIVTPDGTVCNLRDSQCPDVSEAIEAILDGSSQLIAGTLSMGTYTNLTMPLCYQVNNMVFARCKVSRTYSGVPITISGLNLPSTTILDDGYRSYSNRPYVNISYYDNGSLYRAMDSDITIIDTSTVELSVPNGTNARWIIAIFAVEPTSS